MHTKILKHQREEVAIEQMKTENLMNMFVLLFSSICDSENVNTNTFN